MNFVKAIRVSMVALVMMAAYLVLPGIASAQVSIAFSVGFPPPELPVYEQPQCPGDGYIWTPGYWSWDDDDDDYYWVPGTWVEAPEPGYLYTPGYWFYEGDRYEFHEGYWGPEVGFYGGIDYGYGYTGRGYEGGRWEGRQFYYNRSVNNVVNVRNVYNTTIVNNVNVTRVSYNGPNGVNVRPTQREEEAARGRRVAEVPAQRQQLQTARGNRELHASENRGKPPIAATSRPGSFNGSGVVAARAGGNYNPPANRGGTNGNRAGNANRPLNENRPSSENRANENRPPNEASRPGNNREGNNNPNRPPSANNRNRSENNPNRGENNANRPTYTHPNDVPKHTPAENPNADARYQQQQQKLYQKQEQEHQKLQQRQDQEHQRAAQQKAPEPRQQQMEQRHQQQTQKMEQKHEQQQQKTQQRQQPQPQKQEKAPPRQNQDRKPNQ